MARLTMVITVAMFMALIVSVGGDGGGRWRDEGFQIVDLNVILQSVCRLNLNPTWANLCNSFSSTTSTSTTTISSTTTTEEQEPSSAASSTTTESETSTSTTNADTSTPSASTLERAHWCRFMNGSYLALGHTFMHTDCALCQCLLSRAIRCTNLQCMPTYCIDGSTPRARAGQCCSQCSYENSSAACVINGVSFPHGESNIFVPLQTSLTVHFFFRYHSSTIRKYFTMLVSIRNCGMS